MSPPRDPRLYQIAVLSSLLVIGMWRLQFDVGIPQIAVTLGTAVIVQLCAARLLGSPDSGVRSALISGLSLCLLLRTNELPLAALAAAVAISSKFLVRVRGKHVFNPTNLAIVVLLIFFDDVWVSPGQWGAAALSGFLLACAGTLVVTRAARADVTFAFLATHAGLLVGRALWLGDPLTIPMHRLQSGALLLFAFFMISDPRTTPSSRAGRVIFAVLVAAGTYYVHQVIFRTNGLMWSLAACSLLVPVIDRLLPGRPYDWPGQAHVPEGSAHETRDFVPAPRVGGVVVH